MKQWAMAALALGIILSAAGGASAIDVQPEDEIELQSCIEGVRDYNSSAEPGQEASRDECIGMVASPCMETEEGQSTMGMIGCHARELAVWDAMLNDNYAALEDATSPAEFQALRDIQVKWIAYREAKCGWPAVFFQGGTIAGPLAAACLNDMTARRANELANYLEWTQN